MNQPAFDSAMLAIVEATPDGERVNMHAAMSTLRLHYGAPTYWGNLWAERLDGFSRRYPTLAEKLSRRTDRRPRRKRSVNYNRRAVRYLKDHRETWSELVLALSMATTLVDVAMLKKIADLHFNANFNNPIAQILASAMPSHRHLLRMGKQVTGK
jgi:hypothetical protein